MGRPRGVRTHAADDVSFARRTAQCRSLRAGSSHRGRPAGSLSLRRRRARARRASVPRAEASSRLSSEADLGRTAPPPWSSWPASSNGSSGATRTREPTAACSPRWAIRRRRSVSLRRRLVWRRSARWRSPIRRSSAISGSTAWPKLCAGVGVGTETARRGMGAMARHRGDPTPDHGQVGRVAPQDVIAGCRMPSRARFVRDGPRPHPLRQIRRVTDGLLRDPDLAGGRDADRSRRRDPHQPTRSRPAAPGARVDSG